MRTGLALLDALEARSVRSSRSPGPVEEDTRAAGGGPGPVHRARRYDRIDTRLRCWCEDEGVTFYARMANLSQGGLFVRTRTPLGVGAQATVRFEPRSGTEITARVRVMWTRPDGMGLRFDHIDEAALAVIRRIIDNDSLSKEKREGDAKG